MYTNLLLFLVAIFLFTMVGVPTEPLLSPWNSLALFGLLLAGFNVLANRLFDRRKARRSAGYFQTEKTLSIAALGFYGGVLFLCDPKFYLSHLPGAEKLPALVGFAGLMLFVAFLAQVWAAGRKNYVAIFGRKHSTASFVISNIKANLPIVLPWVIISSLYDLIALLPFPWLEKLVASQWGDMTLFVVFLGVVVVFFPPLVRRLWGCRRMPDGYLRDHLERFCKTQGFTAEFYLWPLFEGRALTAGVMGLVPGLRYILVTPALLETLSLSELEAVMAHEIGHVRKYHLLLYTALIAGFSVLAGMVAEPLIYLAVSREFVNSLILSGKIDVENVITIVGAIPLLICMLIYFRFIFGYFIRNFERQADLFSLAAVGSATPLVSAFEKISLLSGDIRDEKNWHHFGIGERIDCLEQAEAEPGRIARHNRKVRNSLFIYVGIVLLIVAGVKQLPTESLAKQYRETFAESVLLQKARQEPHQAIWQRMIGDLMLSRKLEGKALAAYEQALSLEPINPEIMNNLAWLLLTAENRELRDASRALTLARGAATINPRGHVLDTLATAYWANGLVDQALQTERQAIAADPAKRRFYVAQMHKFAAQSWDDEDVVKPQTDTNAEDSDAEPKRAKAAE